MKPAELFSHWKQVQQGLIKVIENYHDDLSFLAAPEGWPAGQIMIHIANAEEGWFRYVVKQELKEWPTHLNFQIFLDKGSILKALEEVHQRTEDFLGWLTEEDLMKKVQTPGGETISLQWIIWHVLEHEIHHRGELSLILGMLGKEGLDV